MGKTDEQTLADHRDTLYRRLEAGYARIEQGLAEGNDVTAWEDFWVALLKEYEQVCDEIQADMTRDPESGAALTQGALAWWRGEMAR